MAKKVKIESVIEKCDFCKKKKVTFHLHECKFSFHEYYGCSSCDNWCMKCKKDWNNIVDKKK